MILDKKSLLFQVASSNSKTSFISIHKNIMYFSFRAVVFFDIKNGDAIKFLSAENKLSIFKTTDVANGFVLESYNRSNMLRIRSNALCNMILSICLVVGDECKFLLNVTGSPSPEGTLLIQIKKEENLVKTKSSE